MRGFVRIAVVGLCACLGSVLPSYAQTPLPDPLTLKYDLAQANEPDPVLQEAHADVDAARADVAAADASDGINVSLQGRLRWIEPADITPDNSHIDNNVSLYVRKELYDFGRSSSRQAAAAHELAGQEQNLIEARRRRRLEIMRRYFAVLRADMEYTRDDEALAVAYVDLDKLRRRHKLGEVSDLDLAKKEAEYQQTRVRRYASQGRMRAMRAQLAIALNRPRQLPNTLVMPELPQVKRPLPDYEPLVDKALRDNARLLALRQQVQAAREQLASANAGLRPSLSGEVEASDYSRSIGSNDKLRAGIYLNVPLYDAGSTDAAVARQTAALYRVQARLSAAEEEVRQAVLDQWLALNNLRIRTDEAKALKDYRDLYLDQSRAIYEMEFKTDLGDAMVRMSEAQLESADVHFAIALAWETMDALTGGPLPADAAAGAAQ